MMTALYTVCSEKQKTKSQTCFSSLDMFFRSSDLSLKCSASSLKLHFFMSVITSRSCLFITWNTYMFTILTVSFQMNPGYLVGPMQLVSHHLTLKHWGWLNLSLTYLLGHTHLLTAPDTHEANTEVIFTARQHDWRITLAQMWWPTCKWAITGLIPGCQHYNIRTLGGLFARICLVSTTSHCRNRCKLILNF